MHLLVQLYSIQILRNQILLIFRNFLLLLLLELMEEEGNKKQGRYIRLSKNGRFLTGRGGDGERIIADSIAEIALIISMVDF
jgi:hypothetical protein